MNGEAIAVWRRLSRPLQLAERLTQIGQLRRQRLTGPQISARLGMARSTVGAVLRRLGLGRLSVLDPKSPVIRYERQQPGEMIHLDIKKLGRAGPSRHRQPPERLVAQRRLGLPARLHR